METTLSEVNSITIVVNMTIIDIVITIMIRMKLL